MGDQAVDDGRRRHVRRRLSVDARRDELLETALELFSRRAPEDISIDDVAAAAGASRALVYHYFGGKQELYLAALRRAGKQLEELLDTPAEGTPLERLRVSLGRYFQFVEDHAAGYQSIVRGGPAGGPGEVGEIVEGVRALLLDRIMREIEPERPSPVMRVTLRMWMAAVETAALDWLEHRDLPRPELEALLVDQNIAMLDRAAHADPEVRAALTRLAGEETATGGRTRGRREAAEAPEGGSAA